MDPGGPMEVAALGRPFCLGMLYDCRRDLLVPGITLWDHDDLKNHIREKPQSYSDFDVITSESIEDKSSALKVDASLKASFLSGLVEVDGSAKYLNDKKASRNLARVTLQYKATTKFQELSMNHLGKGNMKHPYVFDKGIATHVVTAILYGAQAFFVFDREVTEKEDHQGIQSDLKALINKIPGLANEVEGSLNLENKDIAIADRFSCRFYGDFSLQNPPSSYQDAVQVYQSLPKLLGVNGENLVPVKVWLLPLTILDASAAQLVGRISIRLVREAQRVLEDFSDLDVRCNDAIKTTTAQQFPQIGKKLKLFKEMCSGFKMEFQQNLAKKLPSIRGGSEEEASLTEILMKRQSSPFNSEDLNEWMNCKESEISFVKSFTNVMKKTKIVPSQSGLHEETLDVEHAVCFVFTSLGQAEPYLTALMNYVKVTTKPDDPQDPQTHDMEKEQWYLSNEVSDTMKKKVKLFSDFAEANKGNKNLKFLMVGLTDKTQKGSSIYLFKDGSCISRCFQPPSKPKTVMVSNVNHNSMTLRVSPPTCGAEDVTSYLVEYAVHGEDGWCQKTVPKSEEITVSDLRPNTEYVFRCRGVTSVGVGPVNEVSESLKTLPCSPPGKPHVEPNSSEIYVSWERPNVLGQEVQVLRYIVEYAQTDNKEKDEDLNWTQTVSRGKRAVVSGLQSEAEHLVRVRCDCGVAGRSKESVAVKVCTTKFSPLTEALKSKSERISSDSVGPSVYKLPLTDVNLKVDGCRRFDFGKESTRTNRTIILLGEPGSKMSTLVNAMVNYIVGVEWKDDFRFTLMDEIQLHSQAKGPTTEVVVYKINHQEGFKIDYSLTIVAAADFGNLTTSKGRVDNNECLIKLFSVSQDVTAVCIVAPAALTSLTATGRFVNLLVPSLSNKSENIRVLLTGADAQRPVALEAIGAAGVPCPKSEDGLPLHFKFNNSALFTNNKSSGDEEDESYNEMFWNTAMRSMKKFFVSLSEMETESVTLLAEGLQEEFMFSTHLAVELMKIADNLDRMDLFMNKLK